MSIEKQARKSRPTNVQIHQYHFTNELECEASMIAIHDGEKH
jgi:hypothetical protein